MNNGFKQMWVDIKKLWNHAFCSDKPIEKLWEIYRKLLILKQALWLAVTSNLDW